MNHCIPWHYFQSYELIKTLAVLSRSVHVWIVLHKECGFDELWTRGSLLSEITKLGPEYSSIDSKFKTSATRIFNSFIANSINCFEADSPVALVNQHKIKEIDAR